MVGLQPGNATTISGEESLNDTTSNEYNSSWPTNAGNASDIVEATALTEETTVSGDEALNTTVSDEFHSSWPSDTENTSIFNDLSQSTFLTEPSASDVSDNVSIADEETQSVEMTDATSRAPPVPTELSTTTGLETTSQQGAENLTDGWNFTTLMSVAPINETTEAGDFIETTTAETSVSAGPSKITEQTTTSESTSEPMTDRNTKDPFECDSTFCKAEAAHLQKIFESGRDPCNNFYEFACADWKKMSKDSQPYETADDALTGYVEEMARTVLDGNPVPEMEPLFNLWDACNQKGAVKDSQLKEILTSFGLNMVDIGAVTGADVLRAAGSVLYKLDSAPLLSLDMTVNPMNDTLKMLAFDDADTLLSRQEATLDANKKSMTDLACKFMKIFYEPGQQNDTLCDAIAHIAIQLASTSSYDRHLYDRMLSYAMMPYRSFSVLEPFLSMVEGTKNYTGSTANVIGKNTAQLYTVMELLKSPGDAMAYVAFHTAVYLSPFLEEKEDFWEPAMVLVTRRTRPHPVPKWRLCLRLLDRLLPGMMIVTFQKDDTITPLFSDLMARADVIADEVRYGFVDDVEELDRVENYTRFVLTLKADKIGLHSFFTAENSINVFVNGTSRAIQANVPWNNNPIEYFLGVSAYMAALWANGMRHPLAERRRGLSMFDTNCQFNPEENAVVFPLALFNFSVPTSAKERMFHIPRVGPRLSGCLLRATFSDNIYRSSEYMWTQHSGSSFNATAHCLASQYRDKIEGPSLYRILEDSAGVVVSYEVFQERLFSKLYLHLDYSFAGLPLAVADQLFFVYYAQTSVSYYMHRR
ncbi:EEF1AKMT4-ECE2 readthrough transcript protein-like [Amblyomma americanum]